MKTLKQIQEKAIKDLKFSFNIRASSIVKEYLKLAYELGGRNSLIDLSNDILTKEMNKRLKNE